MRVIPTADHTCGKGVWVWRVSRTYCSWDEEASKYAVRYLQKCILLRMSIFLKCFKMSILK